MSITSLSYDSELKDHVESQPEAELRLGGFTARTVRHFLRLKVKSDVSFGLENRISLQ